jgi:pyruvate,water dikinase
MTDGFLTDWPTSERFPHYTRANAGEVMGDPVSPLGWTFGWEGAMVLGLRDGWIRGGTHELADFDAQYPETFGMFGGYFYLNLSSCRMQGVRNPGVTVEQLDMAFFGDHPDVPSYVPHPDDEKPHLVENIDANTAFVMAADTWPEIDDDKAAADALRESRGDLTERSDADLVQRARSIRPMLHHLFEQHTVSGSSAAIGPGILAAVGEAIGDPTIPMKLLAGIGDVDSALPSHALWAMSRKIRASDALTAAFDSGLDDVLQRLAAAGSTEADDFLADWDAFIHEFGSRGPNEWDMHADSWETRPALALAALDRVRFQSDDESPHLRHDAVAAKREEITAEVRAEVADDEELAGMVEAALIAGNMMAYRERTKTTIVKVIHEGRMVFRELGRRHAEAGDLEDADHIFMLLEREVDEFVADPASFRDPLSRRAADYEALWDLEPPFIIRDGIVPPISKWERRTEAPAKEPAGAGAEIVGVSGSPGLVRGTARVVLDPGDPTALDPGDILVAPYTDPSWTPLFMTAGGVVVDVGGQISHAVIVSRELGLPCVISATDATGRIPDGATIEVDGSTGTVTVIELA